jgi:hypothetical protein
MRMSEMLTHALENLATKLAAPEGTDGSRQMDLSMAKPVVQVLVAR